MIVSYKKEIRHIYFNIMIGNWKGLYFIIVKIIYNLYTNLCKLFKHKILHCPICSFKGYSFIHLNNSIRLTLNSECPKCHSRSRHRGLFFLYKEMISKKRSKKILHFAPENFLIKSLNSNDLNEYHTADLFMEKVSFREDLQKLSFKNNSYDIVLNNHVLEHISNDIEAIKEIQRILKPDGVAIITVPGNWKKKTKKFLTLQNNGHYRDYGFDFIILLKKIFSKVSIKKLNDYNGESYAIKNDEIAFVCIK